MTVSGLRAAPREDCDVDLDLEHLFLPRDRSPRQRLQSNQEPREDVVVFSLSMNAYQICLPGSLGRLSVIELGGGQGNLAGDMMDGIFRAAGYTRKEREAVLAKRLTALQVGALGISNLGTMQGGSAQRRIRGPPFPLST
jgi:hypothetical protein